MTTKKYTNRSVLLFLPATDFNEPEYLIVSDTLNKTGIKIFIVSDANFLCVGSNGLKVKNDIQLYNVHENNFGGLIIIGGKGTRNYWNNKTLQQIVQRFSKNKKVIGAICSAPIVLAKAGVISKTAACYPDDVKELEEEGVSYVNCFVVNEDKIITAQDPSSSNEFIKTFLYELSKN